MRGFGPRPGLGDLLVFLVLVAISIAGLTEHQIGYFVTSPWTGLGTVLPATAEAAVRVALFWGLTTVVLGGVALRIEPRLSLLDAALCGALGLWILAWIGGNALGPVGLYRSWTLWLLVVAAGGWLCLSPPRVARPRLAPGHWLVVLTTALVLPGLLLVQLGSPVPPYMDILATPAAAQRVVTFGRYLPFDSDPYGFWGPVSQLPGLELFYATLALGGRTAYAVLADSGALAPMTCLFMLTTYRLGRTVGGDLVGGMATLFLTATMFFRVLPYMHGRTVSFVLLGTGLAFILDSRRTTVHLVVGALALGTAVATHAVYGALGLAVAAGAVLGWLLSGQVRAGTFGTGLLAGAALVGVPTVAIALRQPVPYPVISLVQLTGVALIVLCARRLSSLEIREYTYWPRLLFAVAVGIVLVWHPPPLMGLNHPGRFPLLVYVGGVGLACMGVLDRKPMRVVVGPLAFAVALSLLVEWGANKWHVLLADPEMRQAVLTSFHKTEYWYPYVLVFPTGYLAALVFRRAPRLTMYVLLAVLMIPWRDRLDPRFGTTLTADPNYHQHSIVEGWSYQAETGKRGYWGSTRDRRWTQSPAQLAAAAVLREEVEAGRITPETHVVHVSAYVTLYQDVFWFSVYTGINDDSYLTDHTFNMSDAGSRLRPIEDIHARLAERPPYVAIHNEPSVMLAPEVLREYETIFDDDGVRLLRHRSVLRAG